MKEIQEFCKKIKSNFNQYKILHRPLIGKKDFNQIKKTLSKSEVSTYGKNTEIFERKLSKYFKSPYIVSTINGTSSLHAILSYLKIDTSHEVLVQSLTFVGTINPILYVGASPHFIESCEKTLAADPIKLEDYLNSNQFIKRNKILYNKKTKKKITTLIITHIYGYPADIDKIKNVAKKFNLILIEDAAETIGTTYKKKKLGTFGDFSIISFNGNKTITTGAGGAIICKRKTDFKKIKHIITTSKNKNNIIPDHTEIGFNYRMPSLNASLGISQLSKLNSILKSKRNVYNTYIKLAKNSKRFFNIYLSINDKKNNNFWIVLIICKNRKIRDIVLKEAIKFNIAIKPIWKPMHKLSFLKKYPKMKLEIVNSLSTRVLCLPSSPNSQIKI